MYRDCDMLKQKFDRLANEEKPTGNPLCPVSVRRAKKISRKNMKKAGAYAINCFSEDEQNPFRPR